MTHMIIQLETNDLQSTIRYYTQVLHFQLVLEPGEIADDVCMMQFGETAIQFKGVSGDHENDHSPIQDSGRFEMFLYVDEIQTVYNRIADFADISQALHTTNQATTQFSIFDNNGYTIHFCEVMEVDASLSIDLTLQ